MTKQAEVKTKIGTTTILCILHSLVVLCIPSELPTPLQFLAVKAALYLGVSLTDSLTGTD